MKYDLIKYPNNLLTTTTIPVVEFNKELHEMLDEMKLIMLDNDGIGLAATQVGSNLRVFIATNLNGFKMEGREIVEFINPVIIEKSKEGVFLIESCLSLPDVFVRIPRAEEVTVKAQDRNGVEFVVVCRDLESVMIQHEMEHLDGKFFIDNLSRQQRRAALKGVR